MEITQILENVKENWFQILTATGTVIALITGKKNPNLKTKKKIKKLERKQDKEKAKATERLAKIEKLKELNKNASSNGTSNQED